MIKIEIGKYSSIKEKVCVRPAKYYFILEEKKKDNFKESIQKCYKVTARWGSPETYSLLKQTGVKDLSDITKIDGTNILELAKENGAENMLYENYLNALNCNNEKEIEAFKKTDLYDIFMKRYEEEHGKLKIEN